MSERPGKKTGFVLWDRWRWHPDQEWFRRLFELFLIQLLYLSLTSFSLDNNLPDFVILFTCFK
jgi:hypothetical protein